MDKQNNHTDPNWLDDVLGTKHTPKELGPDEIAVAAAGLSRPDEAELEKIIQETLAENWGDEPAKEAAPAPAQKPAPTGKPKTKKPASPEATEKKETGKKNFLSWGSKSKGAGENLWGIPHIISSVIWLVVIVAIGVSVGRLGWLCATDLLALGKTPKEQTIEITETDDLSSVSQRLKDMGMIDYPNLFELFAKLTNKGDNFMVGTVTFSGEIVYDYNALCNAMTYKRSSKDTVEVLIPEGYSCAQTFKLLEEKGVCTAKELEDYAKDGELDRYWFLDGVERGHKYSLEGFLFPDTYEFYVGDTPRRVIEKFLDAFDYRFSDRMKDKYTALNNNLKLNLSIREVVIMASIIEKEKANHLEGYTIASVFYNRLTHSASYPYLNSDATLLYDVEYYTGKGITNEQKANSPYNTYTRKGLPIAPIANPGLGSLDAALDPESTNYYYFVYDKNAGQHLFSKTLSEHQKKAKDLGL